MNKARVDRDGSEKTPVVSDKVQLYSLLIRMSWSSILQNERPQAPSDVD